MKYKKWLFTELRISLAEHYQHYWKMSPESDNEK